LIDAYLGNAPGDLDDRRIEMRQPARGVGRVNRRRERINHLAEAPLTLAERQITLVNLRQHAIERLGQRAELILTGFDRAH
jgi:hypothetical protein